MYRIRESKLSEKTINIWVDGRVGDRDLNSFRDILDRYLALNKKVVINLSCLNHTGLEVKKFLNEIKDQAELVELPEHIRVEIMK